MNFVYKYIIAKYSILSTNNAKVIYKKICINVIYKKFRLNIIYKRLYIKVTYKRLRKKIICEKFHVKVIYKEFRRQGNTRETLEGQGEKGRIGGRRGGVYSTLTRREITLKIKSGKI